MLYLFSSNAQPQYAQDILNALAAPIGHILTYRYSHEFVDAATRTRWGDLVGENVLVHFSLQQPAHYFDAVLFPVRRGTVTAVQHQGGVFMVSFAAGDYVAFHEPQSHEHYYEHPREYRTELSKAGVKSPYVASATWSDHDMVAQEPSCLDQTGLYPPRDTTNSILFQRIVQYLGRTETYSEARFYFAGPLVDVDSKAEVSLAGNHYALQPGKLYQLQLFQSQLKDVHSEATLNVVVDGTVLKTVGDAQVKISSPYDIAAIEIATTPTDDNKPRTAVIAIVPDVGVLAPRLSLPVAVKKSGTEAFVSIASTGLGLALLGLATLLPWAWQFKAGAVLVFASLAAWLNQYGWSSKKP